MTHFVTTTLVDDDAGKAANLNYWAYWVGEGDHVEPSDDFIGTARQPRGGTRLLQHLVERLDPSSATRTSTCTPSGRCWLRART